ncbi:MAG: hypothetical protein B6I29_05495 [Marinitoga sp. 4572_148]|nr:MAG: hypothetical protein B6I29_05495 [Marinitoga sp. 4572_148]
MNWRNKMKDYFLIVNPHSSGSKAIKLWPIIKEHLKNEGFDFDYSLTEGRMHAYQLTIEAIKKGYRYIIGVGGDGTINEIVNGLFNQTFVNPEEIVIGSIPTGTGNDWGKSIGIPNDYMEAIRVIKRNNVIIQDVGKVEYYENNEKVGRWDLQI